MCASPAPHDIITGMEQQPEPKEAKSLIWKKLISGAIIGVGAIIPGVSGGIMAVALGVYKRMIDAFANLLKAPKAGMLYLWPILLGMLIGFLSMSNAVEWLMLNLRTPTLFLFIGLVLGGVPTIVREGNGQAGFRPRYLAATAIGLVAVLLPGWMGGSGQAVVTVAALQPLQAFLSGCILALGTIVPGVGVSFVLVFMGVYEPLMAAVNRFDLGALAWVGIGFVCVALLLVKVMQFLFDRYSGPAYYAALGFTLASVILIIPGLEFGAYPLWNVALLAAGLTATFLMDRKSSDLNR